MMRILLALGLVLGLAACSSNTPLDNNPDAYHSVQKD